MSTNKLSVTVPSALADLVREPLTVLAAKLLDGDAELVATAWARMYRVDAEQLEDERLAYEAFFELRMAYGREWPIKALTDYLCIFARAPDAEKRAEAAWRRALGLYREKRALETSSEVCL